MTFDRDIWLVVHLGHFYVKFLRSRSWIKVQGHTGKCSLFGWKWNGESGKPYPAMWRKSRPELATKSGRCDLDAMGAFSSLALNQSLHYYLCDHRTTARYKLDIFKVTSFCFLGNITQPCWLRQFRDTSGMTHGWIHEGFRCTNNRYLVDEFIAPPLHLDQ